MENNPERSYAAFISYRHLPLDRRVALLVQRRLESYVVPKEYRDRVGRRRLSPVFRDEDELPLSSNLTDSILQALDRSEYLIVICTPELPKSLWCEAEIRYFLKHHDRNRLLAVLADGTPAESFSPLMLHEFDGDGNIVRDIEPLAANIAGPNHAIRRGALAKELTRLRAAVLGCPFDALWQRERRAFMGRLALLLAVVLAALSIFFGMLFTKNREIHASLMASYVNTAIRADRDGDPAAALAYYAAALDGDPDGEDARLGALIELQKYDWLYEEALTGDERAALTVDLHRADLSSKLTEYAWADGALTVEFDGSAYRLPFAGDVSPSVADSEYALAAVSASRPKVCPLAFDGRVAFAVLYGGYVDFYGADGGLERRIDLAALIADSTFSDERYGYLYVDNDFAWEDAFCHVYGMRGHRVAVVQLGGASLLIDAADGEILDAVDFVGGDEPTRAYFSPDEARLVFIYDHANPTSEGEAEDLWPRLYVYGSEGDPMADGKYDHKHALAGGELSDDGEGILWAEGRTISLLSGRTARETSAVLNTRTPLREAAFDDAGRVVVSDADGQKARFRAARFNGAAGVAYEEHPWSEDQVCGRFRLPGDSATLELLDDAGNAVDAVALSPYFENEFGLNLIASPDGRTVFVMGYYQDNFLRITADGDALGGVENVEMEGGRYIQAMDAFDGGVLVAVDGGTVFHFADGDALPRDAIEVMEIGAFTGLKVCGERLMAVNIDEMDREHGNVQLWDFRANRYLANLEDSATCFFFDLEYDGNGLLSYARVPVYDGMRPTRRFWRLTAPKPDRQDVAALLGLTSYTVNADQTLSVKPAAFAGLGGWSAVLQAEYPYEPAGK